jgi:hypothetical protein
MAIEDVVDQELHRERQLRTKAEANEATARAELADYRIRAELADIAKSLGFLYPNDGVDLVLKNKLVRWDAQSGHAVGIGAFSPKAQLERLAAKSPYHLDGGKTADEAPTTPAAKATAPAAATTTLKPDQIFGNMSNGKLANDLAFKNPNEYARLKLLAIELGILPRAKRRQ